MKKIASRLISGIAAFTIAFTIAPKASADPVPVNVPSKIVPTKAELEQSIARTFVEEAYENARLNSPFASFNAEPADSAFFNKVSKTAAKMVDFAAKFLGTRYILGATGPKAFDCSGFIGYVYRNFGITLDRTSRQQYRQGMKVNLSNLRPGDLLFFSSRSSGRGNVGHVAMVTDVNPDGTCRFIHASSGKGHVTYQKFPDGGYYERNFIGARRILGTSLAANSPLAQN